MSEQKELVLKTIDDIKDNMELFYQQKEKEALKRFDIVICEITEAVDTLFAYKQEHEDFPLVEAKIANSLKDAMNALEDLDLVLLADILQYDFVEYMEEIVSEME